MQYLTTKHTRGNVTATVLHNVQLGDLVARAVLSAVSPTPLGSTLRTTVYQVVEARQDVIVRCTMHRLKNGGRLIGEPEDAYGRLALAGEVFIPSPNATVFLGCTIEKTTCTVFVFTSSALMNADAAIKYAPREGVSFLEVVSMTAALLDSHAIHYPIGDTFDGASGTILRAAKHSGGVYAEPIGTVTTMVSGCGCWACWRQQKKEHAPDATERGLMMMYVFLSLAIGVTVAEVLR